MQEGSFGYSTCQHLLTLETTLVVSGLFGDRFGLRVFYIGCGVADNYTMPEFSQEILVVDTASFYSTDLVAMRCFWKP